MLANCVRNLINANLKLIRTTTTTAAACAVETVARRYLNVSLENDKYVVVQADPGHGYESEPHTMKFPGVWLRDNCTCSKCYHQSSQSRHIDWNKFDTKVKVIALKADAEQKQVHIKWSDEHESVYDLQWLREREFNAERRQEYLSTFYRPKTVHWSAEDFSRVTKIYNFKDVMHNDEVLQSWLESLAVYGVAIIKDSPLDKSVVRQLAERVGFIRRTTYGEEFVVMAKPGAKNYAYLSHPLPLHTDLPYYEYKPSVNILHCMAQTHSSGGSNLLVDGFHIADRLRLEHEDDYKILTETLVDWNDIGSEEGKSFHNIWRSPVICLDSEGNYTRINHSVPQRDSHFSVDLSAVLPWYDAYAKFVHMARDNAHAFKTQPGDVLTFNNLRLLHGRTGYDDSVDNVRYIVGAYLDWDIIYSKLRVLKTIQAAK